MPEIITTPPNPQSIESKSGVGDSPAFSIKDEGIPLTKTTESLGSSANNLANRISALSIDDRNFVCDQCSFVASDMTAHILETRHSTIFSNYLGRNITCEDCGKSDILQLVFLFINKADPEPKFLICRNCVFGEKVDMCCPVVSKNFPLILNYYTRSLTERWSVDDSEQPDKDQSSKLFGTVLEDGTSVLAESPTKLNPLVSRFSSDGTSSIKHSRLTHKYSAKLSNSVSERPVQKEECIPKLTYSSMDEYCREMCYKLCLEEESQISENGHEVLMGNDFSLEWSTIFHEKKAHFTISTGATDNFLRRFMSKTMIDVGKLPFFANQGMIMMSPDEKFWYCVVEDIQLNHIFDEDDDREDFDSFWHGGSVSRARRRPKTRCSLADNCNESGRILTLNIKSLPWNDPLPTTKIPIGFELLPTSVPTSRVFAAMMYLRGSKFESMLLGSTTIVQSQALNGALYASSNLNNSQTQAVRTVLSNSITFLQGPPGTGKTSTIYSMITELLARKQFPILVVAAANLAVDNVAEKMMEQHEISMLRIVAKSQESEYNSSHRIGPICLHRLIYNSMPRDLRQVCKRLNTPGSYVCKSDYKKVMSYSFTYSEHIISQKKVIYTTSVAAGGIHLRNLLIPIVIMDEATQSSETTSLIPLALPYVKKFVFVGDQKQLSSFTTVRGLSYSLFERTIANGVYKDPIMLDKQYRMHPAISEFPRNEFYNGKLRDGITALDRQCPGISSNPVVFWDTGGKCREMEVYDDIEETENRSYANIGEVSIIEQILIHFTQNLSIDKPRIGVITPYKGQRDLISEKLAQNRTLNPLGKKAVVRTTCDEFQKKKSITVHVIADIIIASIDAFQGREKDFIIMSLVRSNVSKHIGFLNDRRRLNVALTRAKYGLILIGDLNCLRYGDVLWRDYANFLESKGCIRQWAEFKNN